MHRNRCYRTEFGAQIQQVVGLGDGVVGRGAVIRVAFGHDTTEFGGVEVVLSRVFAGLDRDRFEQVLVVPDTDDPFRRSPQELIAEAELAGVRVEKFRAPGLGVLGQMREFLSAWKLFRRVRPDVLHIHTSRVIGARKLSWAAWCAQVPVIVRTEHNSPTAFSQADLGRRRIRLFDAATDRIYTVSFHDRQEQIELVPRDSAKVVAVQNGVDHHKYSRSNPEVVGLLRPDGVDGDVLAVAVGRLSPQKGFGDLVKAHAELRSRGVSVALAIAGTGELESELRALAKTLGVEGSVWWLGQVDDVRPLLAAADIAVMSSLHEGFSLALLEMMSFGLPTVVTDHPGLREAIVEGSTSLVVPRSNPAELASAIAELVQSEPRRKEMGRAARAHVEAHHTLEAYLARVANEYVELLGRRD